MAVQVANALVGQKRYSFKAGEDLAGWEKKFVKFAADSGDDLPRVLKCDASGDIPDGVLVQEGSNDTIVLVDLIGGGSELDVTGAVNPGAKLALDVTTNNVGQGAAVTASGSNYYATALGKTGSSGGRIAVNLETGQI